MTFTLSARNKASATDARADAGSGHIVAHNMSIQFPAAKGDPFTALRGVDMTIEKGKFICVIGPSGCGKSTILNAIAGLVQPAVGSISYGGHVIRKVNQECGYITQHDTLLPWATVESNVQLGLRIRNVPRSKRGQMTDDVLKLVGLSDFKNRYPSQLSGGMRKRALLARTLVYEPETLLMDEPFGALDAQLRMRLQQDLLALWERERKTVIFVTHDLDEALLLADEIVIIGDKPGRVVHRETVDLPRPRDPLRLREDPQFWALWQKLWQHIDTGAKSATLAAAESKGTVQS